MKLPAVIALLAFAFPVFAEGQVVPRGPGGAAIADGIFAAGTTALDPQGKPLGYVFISAPDMDSLAGKHFAVHLKPAGLDAAGAFTLQGVAAAQHETAVVSGLIERAIRLGENREDLEHKLRALYRQTKFPNYLSRIHVPRQAGDPPHPEDPPQPGEPGAAEQLASVVRRAATDAATAATLRQLATGSPAVALAAGLAWAGPLNVPVGHPVTLEIRLFDPITCTDIGVVGRVSFQAGQPQPLPAPGKPIEVPNLTPTGHLNIKLRWAQTEDLRRQSLLSLGFNLYRMPKAFAISQGYDATSPATATLLQLAATQPQNVRRLNEGALFASGNFTEANIADFAADPTTYFVIDDNDRSRKDAAGQPLGVPFMDGEAFRYFVTARDLLGRDGEVSQSGAAIACHRLPPPTPTGLVAKCEHVFDPATQLASDPFLLSWKANAPSDPALATSRYEIIRGLSSGDPLIGGNVNDGENLERYDPTLLIPYASVPHGPSPVFTDLLPCVSAAGNTCWYAVRAVFDGACGPIYSDPSPPVFACIPHSGAPLPPMPCSNDNNVPLAAVALESTASEAAPAETGSLDYRLRVTCRRVDAGVTWAQFRLQRGGTDLAEPVRVYFPAEFDPADARVETEFIIRASFPPTNATLECRIGTAAGVESALAPAAFSFLPGPSRRVLNFFGCACSMADLPASGALRSKLLNSTPLATTPVGANANGYLVFNVAGADETPVVLQRFSGGLWRDSGSAFIAHGQVAIPAGANESFRALRILAAIPAASRCSHQRLRNDGGLAPVPLRVCLTPETNEYRVYRRIDDGPLTLVAQGDGPYAKAEVKEIGFEDNTLPISSGRAVYFAQMIDRDGNASPLAQISHCVNLIATPPAPILQEPKPLLEGGVAKVALGWFCPPVGVERFIVHIEPQETGAPAPIASGLTPAHLVGFTIVHQVFDQDLALRLGLIARTRYLTGRVGSPVFQPGPDFSLSVQIQRNVRYKIWVKTVATTGGESAPSKSFDFTWRTPPPVPVPGVEQKVPWPARALVKATEYHPLVKAESLSDIIYPFAGAESYPVGVRIGSFPNQGRDGLLPPVNPSDPLILFISSVAPSVDPNTYLYPASRPPVKTPLPAVLYRRQVPNVSFPVVSGDVIQVSPLVKAIAWEHRISNGDELGLIRDPFIGFRFRNIPNGPADALDIFLLDTQPVVVSASYHYYLVRFHDNGEVESVIDAGEVYINPGA